VVVVVVMLVVVLVGHERIVRRPPGDCWRRSEICDRTGGRLVENLLPSDA
jgi:hypothetical protein